VTVEIVQNHISDITHGRVCMQKLFCYIAVRNGSNSCPSICMQYPNHSYYFQNSLMQDGAMCQSRGEDKGKIQEHIVSNRPGPSTEGFSDAFTAIYCQILSRV